MMKLENVDKYYNKGTDAEVHALKNINLTIEKGEMVAVMGVSGSGKSTLIHILGCLDKQTYGKYFLGEYEVTKYSNNDIAVIRNEEIGFVLQNFGLLADKTVYENISYPLIFNPAVKYKMMKKAYPKTRRRDADRRSAQKACKRALGRTKTACRTCPCTCKPSEHNHSGRTNSGT